MSSCVHVSSIGHDALNRVQSSRASPQKEVRIILAIQAVQRKGNRSIRDAARRFNVSGSTLRCHSRGTTGRAGSRASCHKMREIEEDIFQERIYHLINVEWPLHKPTYEKLQMLYLSDVVQPRFRLSAKNRYRTLYNAIKCLNLASHDDLTAKKPSKKTQRLFKHGLTLSKLQSNKKVFLQMISSTLTRLILQWGFVTQEVVTWAE